MLEFGAVVGMSNSPIDGGRRGTEKKGRAERQQKSLQGRKEGDLMARRLTMGLVEGNQDALEGGASVQVEDTPTSGVRGNSIGCLVEKFNAALVH